MSQLKRICDFLFHANVIKTVIFNFRMLPKEQAIRLPIWLYGRVDIGERAGMGKIIFSSKEKPHFGGWKIGNCDRLGQNYYHPLTTFICVKGTLCLGERGCITNGAAIQVWLNAFLLLGSNIRLGPNSKIYCQHQIKIKDNVKISWEVQIFDTNFHYYVEDDSIIKRNVKAISIGTHCWIGNRVTINKGSIGDFCIIASNSTLVHDYSSINHALFAGTPAKTLKKVQTRIFNKCVEYYLDKLFMVNKNLESIETNKVPFDEIE